MNLGQPTLPAAARTTATPGSGTALELFLRFARLICKEPLYNDDEGKKPEEEMMNLKRVLIGLTVLLFALTGCAAKAATNEGMVPGVAQYDGVYTGDKEMPAAEPYMVDEYSAAADSAGSGVASSTTAFEQMIMFNADLAIAVDDPGKTMEAVQDLAKALGGYIVNSYIYTTYTSTGAEVPEATVTIRVPAEELDAALAQIKAMTGDAAKYTISENISGQDVTQEYTDLRSRLRNLEEADDKLSELYDSAETTEDALAIYSQKMQVTEQIEVIKGQMQYYEKSTSMSSVTVRIVTKESTKPLTVAGWEPQGVAREALQALIDFGKGLVNFLIWLVILIVPVIAVIGLPIYFLVRWLVRRNRRKEEARRQALLNQKPPEL